MPKQPSPRTTTSKIHGVLVVDKPAGPTSHDAVDRVRRALGTRRVGHTGTLDPFATGVLPICVGKATRLARFLVAGEKAYTATIHLGFATTTDDFTGEPLGDLRKPQVTRSRVEAACVAFVGNIDQIPPAFSAKRVDGRKLYELARAGTEVNPAPARVSVHALEVLRVGEDEIEIAVRCSTGTYIRALGRDLGAALGCGGHLTALRRTETGGFDLADAVAWDEVEKDRRAALLERLVPLSGMLTGLPAATVGPEGASALRHGRPLERAQVLRGFPDAPVPERVRILDEEGGLLALAVPRGPVLQPDLVLVD